MARVIAGAQIDTLKHQVAFAKQRADTLDVDLEKLKARYENAERHIISKSNENAKLIADLQAISVQRESDEGLRAQLQVVDDLRARLAKFEQLSSALMGADDEVWNLRDALPPERFESRMRESELKVCTVINLKGGVGKTTLVANLAAYFAKKHGKKVLVIDFDYQGSLTRMMVLGAQIPLGSSILADTLLGGEVDGKRTAQLGRELGAILPGMRLITCGQTFDGFENRTLLRWLLGDTKDDVRFRLAGLLLSPEMEREFDLVLIDAPPRLSTGAMNALCASHAILVPTILDALSVDAVGRFLQRVNRFRQLNPALEFAGVVGTLTEQTGLLPREREALDSAKTALAYWHGRAHVFNRNIRHFSALAKAAGKAIGYLEGGREGREVQAVFNELGSEIVEKLAL
ncbi:MAG TPA: AAA family ATPase [Hyphomicrobiaceae bacterium]|nr:AAA family ATPase [Hyphomicrobiaceae bacterium]